MKGDDIMAITDNKILDTKLEIEDLVEKGKLTAANAALHFEKACVALDNAFIAFKAAKQLRDETEANIVKYSSHLEVIGDLMKERGL